MVPLIELYKIAILLCPVFSSLFAILILLFAISSSYKKTQKIHYHLMAYFGAVFFSWSSAVLYFYIPIVYVYVNWFSMLVFMLMQIFFYGFIFEVTRTNAQEDISRLNYVLPVILSLALLIISLITPVSDQLNVIRSKAAYCGGSKLFFYANYSKIPFRIAFILTYSAMGFKRLFRYHRFIRNYSSNEEKNSLRWVSILLFYSMMIALTPLLKLGASRDEMVYSPIAIVFVFALLSQYAYICLHAIKKDCFINDLSAEARAPRSKRTIDWPQTAKPAVNFPNIFLDEMITDTIDTTDEAIDEDISPYPKKNLLSRDSFDAFMRTEKPYLNADLRITDLVDILHVNRTYISSFINKEYGENFSVFINKYRIQEYNLLRQMPEYSKLSKAELAEMAGFNSYRSFIRTKNNLTNHE